MKIENGIKVFDEHEWDEFMLDLKLDGYKKDHKIISKEKNKVVLIKEKK